MASRTCWHCGRLTHMTPVEHYQISRSKVTASAAFYCDECFHLSIAEITAPDRHYASLADFESPTARITWYPIRAAGREFKHVPAPIAEPASEAFTCHSVQAFRAAVLMARSVVEAMAKDKNAAGTNLYDQINGLQDAGHITKNLAEQAHEIRLLGNTMAHGDFATADITEEEAAEVLEVMAVLLEAVYQQPARLEWLKAQREQKRSD